VSTRAPLTGRSSGSSAQFHLFLAGNRNVRLVNLKRKEPASDQQTVIFPVSFGLDSVTRVFVLRPMTGRRRRASM